MLRGLEEGGREGAAESERRQGRGDREGKREGGAQRKRREREKVKMPLSHQRPSQSRRCR